MSATSTVTHPRRSVSPVYALVDRQTYLNLLYMMLAFPLGLAYFVVLVTGFSLGLGLSVIVVGLPILVGMLLIGRGLAVFERQLAIGLLDARVAPSAAPVAAGPGFWAWLVAHLRDRVTWTGLLFLAIKFPLGLATFVVLVTLFSLAGGLLAIPVLYQITPLTVEWGGVTSRIETFSQALPFGLIGLGIGVVALYVGNGLAIVYRLLAEVALGQSPAA